MHDEQQLGLLIVHLGSDDMADSCRSEGEGYVLTLFEGGSDFQVREVEKLSDVSLYFPYVTDKSIHYGILPIGHGHLKLQRIFDFYNNISTQAG